MSVPKVVAEARARVAAVKAKITAFDAEMAAAQKTREPALHKVEAVRKRLARRHVVARDSQGSYTVSREGLAVWTPDRYGPAGKETKRKALIALLPTVKFDLSGSSIACSFRTVVQRTRQIDDKTLREIDRLDRIARGLEQRAHAARKAWSEAKAAAFEAGDKVEPDAFAAEIADLTLARNEANRLRDPLDQSYKRQWLVDELAREQKHLTWAEGDRKGDCPCPRCRQQREQARWAAEQAARAKAEAERAKAEAKAEAKMPKLRFRCPSCEEWSIAIIREGFHEGERVEFVECQFDAGDCGQETAVESLATKFRRRVPASEKPRWLEGYTPEAPGQIALAVA